MKVFQINVLFFERDKRMLDEVLFVGKYNYKNKGKF